MLPEAAPAVHSLLRVTDLDALLWDVRRPAWTLAALQLAPWTVVRRAPPRLELWPVGVRGSQRAQRSAAAIAVLDEVAAVLAAHGYAGRWGPGGSVGFELASGVPSTTAGSDLDLVLSVDEPMARNAAIRLHADLAKLPVRIDLLLETPQGAAALAEYAKGEGATLLRSALGPRLVADPWSADGAPVGC
jgi:phosphoribosyl-dephospho-CoA transferase